MTQSHGTNHLFISNVLVGHKNQALEDEMILRLVFKLIISPNYYSAILIQWVCSQNSIILKILERLLLNSVLKKNFRIVYSQTGNIFNFSVEAPTWRSVDSGMWSNDAWGTRTKLDGPKDGSLWTQKLITKSSMKTKEKSLEMAKLNVEKNFYFIGILEEFMDSLRMFELVLPRIYTR